MANRPRCHSWYLSLCLPICPPKPSLVVQQSKVSEYLPQCYPIGLWNTKILGGSHKFIAYIGSLNTSGNILKLLPILVLFLVIRFYFSMISYGASVPGGIFMPILVLGALLGVIAAVILIHQGIITPSCFLNIVVISIAAYFGAIEEAAFTAITLLTEMVGSVDQVFPMTILTFIAYIISNLLGGQPIYASLRKEIFKK